MLMDPLPVLLDIFMFIGIFFFIGIFMSTGIVVFIGNVVFFAMPPLSVADNPLKERINNIVSSINPANV
jgi:hypothetical protein